MPTVSASIFGVVDPLHHADHRHFSALGTNPWLVAWLAIAHHAVTWLCHGGGQARNGIYRREINVGWYCRMFGEKGFEFACSESVVIIDAEGIQF